MMPFSSVLISTLLVLSAGSVYCQQKCEADHECPQNRFCYGNSKVCAPCIVCAAYNRQKGQSYCAKEWKDCGPCLNGFGSEDISGVAQRGNCIKADFSYAESTQPTVGTNNMTTSIPQNIQIAIIVVIAITFGSGLSYFVIKGRQRRGLRPDVEAGCREVPDEPLLRPTNGLPPDMPNRDRPPPTTDRDPPAYNQIMHPAFSPARPSAPPSEGIRDEASVTVVISESRDEKLQQAAPFHVDENLRFKPIGTGGEVVADVADDEESEAENASARSTPVNLQEDESTHPSDWAPGSQELHHGASLDDSGVCNFSESTSSLAASEDAPPPPLNFQGLFAHGQLVTRGRRDSSGAGTGERPAKRFRADSGSHSASSSSSEDETHPGDQASGNVLNLSSVKE